MSLALTGIGIGAGAASDGAGARGLEAAGRGKACTFANASGPIAGR